MNNFRNNTLMKCWLKTIIQLGLLLIAVVCGSCVASADDEIRQIKLDSHKALSIGIDCVQPTTLSFPSEVTKIIGGDKVASVGESVKDGSFEIILEHPAHSNMIVIRGANKISKVNLTVECEGKVYLFRLLTTEHPSYVVNLTSAEPSPTPKAVASVTPTTPLPTPKIVTSVTATTPLPTPKAIASVSPVVPSPTPLSVASVTTGKLLPPPIAEFPSNMSGNGASNLILDYEVIDQKKGDAGRR
jgi:hypothetical protein